LVPEKEKGLPLKMPLDGVAHYLINVLENANISLIVRK